MTQTTALIANRKFGIEIEAYNVPMNRVATALNAAGVACSVSGYTHATSASWKVVYDGSIQGVNGFELVSPILEGESGLAAIVTVCRVLGEIGAKVNKSTGLHVHVDARDLVLQEVKNVCRDFIKYESELDALMPTSRRANPYCKGHVNAMGGELAAFARIATASTISNLRDEVNWTGDRYHKLNLHSLVRHGTIEFRQHSGTVESAKICAWVKLVVGLVAGVVGKKADIKLSAPAHRFNMLLSVLPETEDRKFFKARRVALNRSGE